MCGIRATVVLGQGELHCPSTPDAASGADAADAASGADAQAADAPAADAQAAAGRHVQLRQDRNSAGVQARPQGHSD